MRGCHTQPLPAAHACSQHTQWLLRQPCAHCYVLAKRLLLCRSYAAGGDLACCGVLVCAQDNYLAEALKMRNLLGELHPSTKGAFDLFADSVEDMDFDYK